MKVPKRGAVLDCGHKTSITIKDHFWSALGQIADERDKTISAVIREIDRECPAGNLSSAIRVFVLEHFKALAAR